MNTALTKSSSLVYCVVLVFSILLFLVYSSKFCVVSRFFRYCRILCRF